MKFYIIIFVSLILSIYSGNTCDVEHSTGSSAKDCNKLEKLSGYPYCCYFKLTDDEGERKGCMPLTKNDYDNIKDYIKKAENEGATVKDLDCKSIYLELSILSFILLLL
jgi:hypothetical protein